jgi:hypothetical protein
MFVTQFIYLSKLKVMKTYTETEANELMMKLTPGQSMLTSVRRVAGGKFHLELAEKIQKNTGVVNVLSILNAGDSRFNTSGARRAWAPAEAAMITSSFGIDAEQLEALEESEKMFVCILNPSLGDVQLRIQIRETIEGDDYDNANIEKTAKRAGKDGDILTSEGSPIFSKTYVVGAAKGTKVEHTYLVSDQESERKAKASLGAEAPATEEPLLD